MQKLVSYEDFGAKGDGVADDSAAIQAAHAYANAHALPVKSKAGAAYNLGSKPFTATIATDTDWTDSRFFIDDSDVSARKVPLFQVIGGQTDDAAKSAVQKLKALLTSLIKKQKAIPLDSPLPCDFYCYIENDGVKQYIRKGPNQNSGVAQRDCFIIRRDGSIDGDIDWDYSHLTTAEIIPIDEAMLLLQGGVFETKANSILQENGYDYWHRHITIRRSNVTVCGLVHYITGETSAGQPYAGFLHASKCANLTVEDCFATGHKIYSTIGAAGCPVQMGSYDYLFDSIVHLAIIRCRQNGIHDKTRWGVIATNFCKDTLLDGCIFSRMDTHQGVSSGYTIRRCEFGWMGLNAIGKGLLSIEDTTFTGGSMFNLREDYGSTWNGEVVIKNCRWNARFDGYNANKPVLMRCRNDGTHDFGYPCSMPRKLTIDGLFVNDSPAPPEYAGLTIFFNPDADEDLASAPEQKPFPYKQTEELEIKNLSTASGFPCKISDNPALSARFANYTPSRQ